MCCEAQRILRTGGTFFFAVIHPVASGGAFDSPQLDARFVYWTPLSVYFDALREAAVAVVRLAELPTERRAAGRVPMFLHVQAIAADPPFPSLPQQLREIPERRRIRSPYRTAVVAPPSSSLAAA